MRINLEHLKPGILYQSMDDTLCIYVGLNHQKPSYHLIFDVDRQEIISISSNTMVISEVKEILSTPEDLL